MKQKNRLTKAEFCSYMDDVSTCFTKQENFISNLNKVFPSAFEQIYDISTVEMTVKILADLVCDEDGWISFYVFDNGCEGFAWWDKDNNKHFCCSAESLWNLITGVDDNV